MTALLQDRVALWLSDHPNSTCEQVAVGVRARRATVRETLCGQLFTFNVVGSRVLYKLRSSGQDWQGPATGGRETDKEFLARVLSDGGPHNLNEILQRSFRERGCGLTVHSRVSDLRRDGMNVVHWKDGERGNGSWYQLRPLGSAAGRAGLAVDPSGRETDGLLSRGKVPAAREVQLSLTGDAFRRREAA